MIHVEYRDSLCVLKMEHGKANALDTELLLEISDKLNEVTASDARACVLTGQESFFCAGVDLKRFVEEGPGYLDTFMPALDRCVNTLLGFEKPLVAAINGHAMAGGCVVACACDHRIMAEDVGRIGVTEMAVGLPFPVCAMEVMRFVVPPQHLQQVIYSAATWPAKDAMVRGLVDEAVPTKDVLPRSIEVAARYGAIPATSFTLTKSQLRQGMIEAIRIRSPEMDPEVQAFWKSEGALSAVRAFVVAHIGKGKK